MFHPSSKSPSVKRFKSTGKLEKRYSKCSPNKAVGKPLSTPGSKRTLFTCETQSETIHHLDSSTISNEYNEPCTAIGRRCAISNLF